MSVPRNEEVLNSTQVKELLGIKSNTTLNTYMKKGLKHHQISPRGQLIFFRSEVLEFAAKFTKVGVH